jgi:hypothetical protein
MKIFIQSSEGAIIESVKIIDELLGDLKAGGYFYYFPFLKSLSDIPNIDLKKQIDLDIKKKNFYEKVRLFEIEWNKINVEILSILDNYINKQNLSIQNEFFCNLTVYGPYGYYNKPNTIFVNIGTDKKIEFSIETLVHELLHLALEKDTSFSSKEQTEKEKVVDSIFVKIFGKYFTNYHIQNIS